MIWINTERLKQEREQQVENYAANIKLLKQHKRKDLVNKQLQLLALLQGDSSIAQQQVEDDFKKSKDANANDDDKMAVEGEDNDDFAEDEFDDLLWVARKTCTNNFWLKKKFNFIQGVGFVVLLVTVDLLQFPLYVLVALMESLGMFQ